MATDSTHSHHLSFGLRNFHTKRGNTVASTAAEKKNSNRITSLAFKRLRESDPAGWEAAKEAAAAELGVEYKRRKTADEKARETVAKILSEHPSVRAELVNEIGKQFSDGSADTPSA